MTSSLDVSHRSRHFSLKVHSNWPRDLYEHSATLRYINGVAASAVSALVAARDSDKAASGA